jgi:hypothetical protein
MLCHLLKPRGRISRFVLLLSLVAAVRAKPVRTAFLPSRPRSRHQRQPHAQQVDAPRHNLTPKPQPSYSAATAAQPMRHPCGWAAGGYTGPVPRADPGERATPGGRCGAFRPGPYPGGGPGPLLSPYAPPGPPGTPCSGAVPHRVAPPCLARGRRQRLARGLQRRPRRLPGPHGDAVTPVASGAIAGAGGDVLAAGQARNRGSHRYPPSFGGSLSHFRIFSLRDRAGRAAPLPSRAAQVVVPLRTARPSRW